MDLSAVKTRILEHLAIRKMAKKRIGTIYVYRVHQVLGKHQLFNPLQMHLRRPFIHISLGGVRDEAELRGHRRTYVGSMPGKIIAGLIKAQAMNPVICLDEIDKLAGGFKGSMPQYFLRYWTFNKKINHLLIITSAAQWIYHNACLFVQPMI